MDSMSKNVVLEIKPDTLEVVRKKYNLDKPGQMEEAINILRDWVQKQNHFKKKDFCDHFYEISIIGCKGSIERAKTQIDRMCTVRTLLPQFFGNYNIKTDFGNLNEIAYFLMLPKLTNDHHRVEVIKLYGSVFTPSDYTNFYKANMIFAEYVKAHDYMIGFIIIIDLSEANLLDFVTKLNPIELKQLLTIIIEGYGMRIKGIHIISSSKVIDTFVAIVKQVLSPKVAGRINIHKTIEKIHEYIPKSILPKDYGGEERSLKELNDEWIEVLSSKEHMQYVQEMNEAVSDEAFRQKDKFIEQYAGMPGTFRVLSVD